MIVIVVRVRTITLKATPSRLRATLPRPTKAYWVAVKELKLSYHDMDIW